MKKLLFSLIVLVFAVVPASAQNLVVDGDFETPHIEGAAYQAFSLGADIGAWNYSASNDTYGVLLCYDTNSSQPVWRNMYMSDGTQMFHIGESARDNTITQVVSGFTVGAKYELSLAGMNWNDGYLFELGLQVYNADTDSYDLDVVDDMGGPDGPAVRTPGTNQEMPYISHEFNASNTELELSINNPAGAAWTIDDVSIIITGVVVGSTDPTSLDVWENASQGPTSATFSVVLNADPGVNPGDTITVTIDPNSNGNGEDLTVNGSASPIDITFTDTTWDTPQTITVAAIDDIIADGQEEVDFVGFTIVSTDGDPNYDIAVISAVEVTIHDDDSDAVVISKASASVTEGGSGDSYTIELATDPTDPVTIIVAAGEVAISETDSNMVPDPFDCQLTVNGGGSDTLVFTAKEVPQTVTIAAVDDSLFEADPHTIMIRHIVSTTDPIYTDISTDNLSVDIDDNDVRGWSFGDDVALTVNNFSFEDPCLADGGFADFDPCNIIPTHDFYQSGLLTISNPSAAEWATMYKAGHQQAPDGDNILYLDEGEAITETNLDACAYLIEPGPVSYTFEMSVGLPEPNYAGAEARLIVTANDPAPEYRFIDESFTLAGGDLVAGEWVDVKACGVIEADSSPIGGVLSIGVIGSGVHVDNWRLTLGNHPCEDTCFPGGLPIEEGDFDQDCDVDLADVMTLVVHYLNCTQYPECVTGW